MRLLLFFFFFKFKYECVTFFTYKFIFVLTGWESRDQEPKHRTRVEICSNKRIRRRGRILAAFWKTILRRGSCKITCPPPVSVGNYLLSLIENPFVLLVCMRSRENLSCLALMDSLSLVDTDKCTDPVSLLWFQSLQSRVVNLDLLFKTERLKSKPSN